MNILFILSDFPVYSETFIQRDIVMFAKQGVQVKILAQKKGKGYFLESAKNINLKRETNYVLGNYFLRILLLPFYILDLFFFNKSLLKRCFNLKFFSLKEIIYLKPLVWAINLKKSKENFLICEFGNMGELISKFIEFFPEKKFITKFHGCDAYEKNTGKKEFYKNLKKSKCDMFVLSYHMKQRLIKIGFLPNKLHVFPTGINSFDFQFKKYKKKNKIIFLSIGRFTEKKGFIYSIRAFSKVVNKYSNSRYNIIGYGDLKESLEAEVKKLGIENNVCFLGELENFKVINELYKSDVLIVPSIISISGDSEGQPNVIFEAMAVGTPVISTLHSGIPEQIINNKTGFLVKEKSVDELSSKMTFFIKNPEYIKKFGQAGRKFLEKNFDSNKSIKNRIEFIDFLLKK
jgi:colanic acid/amylovoran biosynthesis glycosyltransferase